MDFLLDNSESARVKWLDRNSGQSGKSMYLRNSVSECQQPSLASRNHGRRGEGFLVLETEQAGGEETTPFAQAQRASVQPHVRVPFRRFHQI
jgi:hypothetical protein